MLKRVFAVYDSKVEAYMQPFYARTTGEALRSWEQACNDGNSPMSQHPSDFTLLEIGEYNEKTGQLTGHISLKSVANALEVKRKPTEQMPLLNAVR